jgi:hypothetical protein
MAYLHIEPIVKSILTYLQTQVPISIGHINSEVVDGITIDLPKKFIYNNVPDSTVPVCFTLNLGNVFYKGFEYGTCFIDLELSLSIDFQANSIDKSLTKSLRYIDAISNIFLADCTLGGTVIASGLTRTDKNATMKDGYVDFAFVATVEL